MVEKIKIIKTINFDMLDNAIESYTSKNNNDPYLFMSEDTADEIEMAVEKEYGFKATDINSNIRLKNGVKALYCGYKVFIDDDLKLGIVELR